MVGETAEFRENLSLTHCPRPVGSVAPKPLPLGRIRNPSLVTGTVCSSKTDASFKIKFLSYTSSESFLAKYLIPFFG